MAADEEKSIHEILSLPILLADRALQSSQEAQSFKPENSDLARQLTNISTLLRSATRLTAASAVYDRPIRRVSLDLTKTLDRALTLARKCRHKKTNVLHHVLSITTAADFKKLSSLLASSLADIKWVLSIFNQDSDNNSWSINLSLPPIASTDPILAWVWPHIAAVHSGRAEAAHDLAVLAQGNERNKKIIVEENGVPPLLNMLRESTNVDAQSAAASALCNLADSSQERVKVIAKASGVQVVAKALSEASMKVQAILANLVSKMSEMDAGVQDEFGRENVTRPLVALLGMDVDLAELKEPNSRKTVSSLHSLVEINKEIAKKNVSGFDMSKHYSNNRKEKEREVEWSPEVKSRLKISCANALWKLARGSLSNSRKITETKALLVLAKIIEKEQGELKLNCLNLVTELASVAESNADLKRTSFKPTSPAAKVVLDQILIVINEEKTPALLAPAIKAIGCLASMFPAKEKRIIQSLVLHLDHKNPDVAIESAKALGKFVCDENYNRKEHSLAMVEFNGVPKLMNLLRSNNDRGGFHLHELILLCNLAINVGNSKALEQARAMSVLESAARHVLAHNPDLRDLFANAIHQLTIYQAGLHTHKHG